MIRIRAVKVSTRSYSRQDRLPVKDWNCEGSFVKLALPRDTLLRAILNNQGPVHTAGLTLEVFPLPLMSVNLPGRAAAAA